MNNELDILSGIKEALENVFVYIEESEFNNVDLDNYILNSLQFMSFIVELEDIFSIEFPPELLLIDNFNNIPSIAIIISELKNSQ